MITLATLPDASAQEVFDQVVRHLNNQGMKASINGGCRYRDGHLKCAAGCFIGDDEYSSQIEGWSWLDLVRRESVPPEHADLISSLQFVHDRCELASWGEELRSVAGRFGLSYPEGDKE